MANTRFNYDECRTEKLLQEATGPGRYILNTPGPGVGVPFVEDPQIRLQGWGGNLMSVKNGSQVDINSYLLGINNTLTKNNCKFDNKIPEVKQNNFASFESEITHQSRTTHPSWKYNSLEHNNKDYLFENPQNHVNKPFNSNLDSRILEKHAYESK
jgi:hypothetical protein